MTVAQKRATSADSDPTSEQLQEQTALGSVRVEGFFAASPEAPR
jgi:hypothetical protein